MGEHLKVSQLEIDYGSGSLFKPLSFEISPGERICINGPSGTGKTSLLRCIAGFECPSKGSVWIGNKEMVDQKGNCVEPEKRGVGYVFQDGVLFPHMTVEEQVGLGLFKLTKQDREERIKSVLDTVQLSDLKKRYPSELSGGQQQRVALARTLAPEPGIILLDEPFTGLDDALAKSLCELITAIFDKKGITGILVSHHKTERTLFTKKVIELTTTKTN